MKVIFTYGRDHRPYNAGWTEVEAPDMKTACALFQAIHPDDESGFLSCAGVYTEEQFQRTSMAGPKGNFGQFCHETISFHKN